SASRPRAAIRTSAPEAAKRLAMAKPSPLLPPVTMAARLARSICMQAPKDTLTDTLTDTWNARATYQDGHIRRSIFGSLRRPPAKGKGAKGEGAAPPMPIRPQVLNPHSRLGGCNHRGGHPLGAQVPHHQDGKEAA